MRFSEVKTFPKSVRNLARAGGPFRKAEEKVQAVRGRIASGHPDPFEGMKLTNRGETRVKRCRKYDLPGRSRLVTVVDADRCYLLYAGSHEDSDRWLDRNRGWEPRMRSDGKLDELFTSGQDLEPATRIRGTSGEAGWLMGPLYRQLDDASVDLLLEGVPRSTSRRIETIESTSEESEILQVVASIDHARQRAAIHDVLIHLRRGAVDRAKLRLSDYRGKLMTPDEEARDGASLRHVPVDPEESEKFKHFIRTSDYADWMLFPHPDQAALIEAEFRGAAKLLGVSGSGKTVVVVKRAVVLAKRCEDDVLILTLNRPLANLLEKLVDSCAYAPSLRERITVLPFFVLCQKYLRSFEPENTKLYDDRTWKTEEHIDEIWREYYRCETNNRDAACMQPVHDALHAQRIDAERYIREEFDWIRSAVPPDDRERYLDLERRGRSYPLVQDHRKVLLEGLAGWEEKMTAVGVTDHLGIATALYRHLDRLRPAYGSILIDECQDFGTIEVELISKLVEEGTDSLFLCGDEAQHASWKHQSLGEAGVQVPGARSRRLEQNYRNSRDVLAGAHLLLMESMTDEVFDRDILDPRFANFGGQLPLVLKAGSFEREIAQAVDFARSEVSGGGVEGERVKACVAFCGYSAYEVGEFAKSHDIPVLEEGLDIAGNQSLFFSDLEQTKGFEFQIMVIVNVRDGVIPNPGMPPRERHRDLCRLYVAMTRATLQLVLSFWEQPEREGGAHGDYASRPLEPSLSEYVRRAIEKDSGKFRRDCWRSYVSESQPSLGVPRELEELRGHDVGMGAEVGNMMGEAFLYSSSALGVSRDLASKLRLHVTGQEDPWEC